MDNPRATSAKAWLDTWPIGADEWPPQITHLYLDPIETYDEVGPETQIIPVNVVEVTDDRLLPWGSFALIGPDNKIEIQWIGPKRKVQQMRKQLGYNYRIARISVERITE